MSDTSKPRIKVRKDGPYLVTGGVPLFKVTIGVDESGDSVEWIEGDTVPAGDQYTLCRCGRSGRKPFCDGSHADMAFDGTETAERGAYMDRAAVLEGPGVRVTDVVDLCSEARYCAAGEGLWNMMDATDDPEVADRVIRQASLCPAGRYVAWDAASGVAYEPDLEPSIGLIEDPQLGVSGGLWVRGSIPIESSDGFTYEVRNRQTLCRCGQSGNKPFCDGTHCETGFSDGL
jgi:CDGSH-type Zn-finger protein